MAKELSRKRAKIMSDINAMSDQSRAVLSSLLGTAMAGTVEADVARELQYMQAGQRKTEVAGRFALGRERIASREKMGFEDIASRERVGAARRESREMLTTADVESQARMATRRLNLRGELVQKGLTQREKDLPWIYGISGLDVGLGFLTGHEKMKRDLELSGLYRGLAGEIRRKRTEV